jgi:hypothetical protein
MTILIDQADRERCPACRSHLEQVGFFLIDDQGVRQFRCERHALELLRVAMVPLKTIACES